jgi:hypothetical protein
MEYRDPPSAPSPYEPVEYGDHRIDYDGGAPPSGVYGRGGGSGGNPAEYARDINDATEALRDVQRNLEQNLQDMHDANRDAADRARDLNDARQAAEQSAGDVRAGGEQAASDVRNATEDAADRMSDEDDDPPPVYGGGGSRRRRRNEPVDGEDRFFPGDGSYYDNDET